VQILMYLFCGGPKIPEPFPDVGYDPAPEDETLPCGAYRPGAP
jgi:hypothetical protein